jgi:hypothetical protein
MPEVSVRYWDIDESSLARVVNALPNIVSSALTIEGGGDSRLTWHDIEVFPEQGHPFDIHHGRDFRVRIEAMYFPERAARLDEATKLIEQGLADLLPDARFYVWIVLPGTSAFAEHPSG